MKARPDFGKEPVGRLLVRLSLPAMAAQLILALYNVVDSFFIGQYSSAGLTALSIFYPVQLLMLAAAIGTGVGVGNLISRYDGLGRRERGDSTARTGTALAVGNFLAVMGLVFLMLWVYIPASSDTEEVRRASWTYGCIVTMGSFPMFLESTWTKTLQARGNMVVPTVAQVCGAVVNVVLDPVLIWGWGPIPELGVGGAALATLAGQLSAALITGAFALRGLPQLGELRQNAALIYRTALPSLAMQSMFTLYISGLNLVLSGFSDTAVTILGLYFKIQAFFIVPVLALQNCVLPVLSFNYAAGNWRRCRSAVRTVLAMGASLLCVGTAVLLAFPQELLAVFSPGEAVLEQGQTALRIIAVSLPPSAASLLMPVIFQGLRRGRESVITAAMRHIVLFVPVAWLLSHLGLDWVWGTFPITESLTALTAFFLYRRVAVQEAQKS